MFLFPQGVRSLRGPSQVGVFLALPAWPLRAVASGLLIRKGSIKLPHSRELALGSAWEPEIAKNYGW